MSSDFDPGDRLRRMAGGVRPLEAGLDDVIAKGRRRRRRGIAGGVAGTVAAIILVAGGGSALLSGDDGDAVTTVAQVATTVVATTTPPATAPPTTRPTTIAGPATTIPAAPRPDPDVIVLAESAGEVGVQMVNQGPFTLNPLLENARYWNIVGLLDPAIQRGAWQPGPNGDPEADLVEALPSVRDGTAVAGSGDLVLAYRIREDAVWSDGTPVTADDFFLTWQIIRDTELPIDPELRTLHSSVAAMSIIGPKEFEVTLAPADGSFRLLFPVVVPAHVATQAGFAEDWTEQMWPSAGPFVLSEFRRFPAPRAAQMVLTRNEFYPAPPDAPTRVIIDFYQRDDRGESLAVEAFLNREADALGPTVAWDLRDTSSDSTAFVTTRAFIWEVLFLQAGDQRLGTNELSRLDEIAVRRAMLHALDRGQLATVGDPIDSLVEFFTGLENPSGGWAQVRYDPDAVAALGEPVPLVYTTTSGELTIDIGNEVVGLLNEAGFDAATDFVGDSQAAFERFSLGDFELFALRLVRTPGSESLADMLAVLRTDYADDGPGFGFPDVWSGNPAADEYARLLDEFAGELDPDPRVALLFQAEDLLVEHMVIIPLVERNGDVWLYNKDRITGPKPIDIHHGWLWNLADWRRVDG